MTDFTDIGIEIDKDFFDQFQQCTPINQIQQRQDGKGEQQKNEIHVHPSNRDAFQQNNETGAFVKY